MRRIARDDSWTWDDLEDRLARPVRRADALHAALDRSRPSGPSRRRSSSMSSYVKQATSWSPQVAFYGDSIIYNFGFYLGHQAWTQTIAPLDAQTTASRPTRPRTSSGGSRTANSRPTRRSSSSRRREQPRHRRRVAPGHAAGDREPRQRDPRPLADPKILLVGMLPVGGPADRFRPEIVEINAQLARFVDNQNSFFLDVGPSILAPDQTLTAVDEPDLVHPNVSAIRSGPST